MLNCQYKKLSASLLNLNKKINDRNQQTHKSRLIKKNKAHLKIK
jgi:hypothetical protein